MKVARLGKVVKAISNIDALFVIDATESMGPYLKSVVAAIRDRVTELAKRNETFVPLFDHLYGDYNEQVKDGLDFYALPFSVAERSRGAR